jgi:hypothetical protein
MVTIRLRPIKVIFTVAAIMVSLLMQFPQLVWSQPTSNATDASVATANANSISIPSDYPPDSKPYNLTYGDWGAKWWQWLFSLPQDINPLLDITGEDCAQNQSGPVWFLAGTTGGSIERTCTIPEGKAILFPVLNFVNVRAAPSETEEDLRRIVKDQADKATSLEASVDGAPLQDLQNYRAESPLFNVTLPEGNILGIPGRSSEAVTDGYWVMLQPLPAGEHTIHFRGAYVDVTAPAGAGNIVTEVTYHLIIATATSNTTSPNAANSTTSNITATTQPLINE